MEEKKQTISLEFTNDEVEVILETIMHRADCLKKLRVDACHSGLFSIAHSIDEQLDILSDIECKLNEYELPF